MTSSDEGFFARWSRRKARERSGDAPAPEAPQAAVERDAAARLAPNPAAAPPAPERAAGTAAPGAPPADAATPAPPTLADVAQLAPGAEIARFVGPGVDSSVQHAALKKLFADPHFNVMDGLDTYIDDYNKPDPIPAALLRRLVQAGAAHFVDAAPAPAESASDAPPAVGTDGAPAPRVASCAAANDNESTAPDADEDTALRLQPDDAADAAGAGSHRPRPRA